MDSTKQPYISIVLCCYNVAEYMDNAINSIIGQKYTIAKEESIVANSDDIEIILVEDCSTDNGETKEKCQLFAKKYKNIKVVFHEINAGLSAARNSGIKASSGKYITFPDPDDTMCPNIISHYISCIQEERYDVVCAGLIERHFDQNNNLSLEKPIIQKPGIFKTKKSIAEQTVLLEKNISFGYAWNKLYKKETITKKNIYFQDKLTFIEDILFNIDFCKSANSMRIIEWPAVYYNRRLNASSSITSKYKADYFDLHYKRIQMLYDYWEIHDVLTIQAKQVLANLYFRYAMSAIWRNTNPQSKMTKQEQKNWIKTFYTLNLTNKLIKYTTASSLQTRITFLLFKKKSIALILKEADIINFVSGNMSNFMIKLRQNR